MPASKHLSDPHRARTGGGDGSDKRMTPLTLVSTSTVGNRYRFAPNMKSEKHSHVEWLIGSARTGREECNRPGELLSASTHRFWKAGF